MQNVPGDQSIMVQKNSDPKPCLTVYEMTKEGLETKAEYQKMFAMYLGQVLYDRLMYTIELVPHYNQTA